MKDSDFSDYVLVLFIVWLCLMAVLWME